LSYEDKDLWFSSSLTVFVSARIGTKHMNGTNNSLKSTKPNIVEISKDGSCVVIMIGKCCIEVYGSAGHVHSAGLRIRASFYTSDYDSEIYRVEIIDPEGCQWDIRREERNPQRPVTTSPIYMWRIEQTGATYWRSLRSDKVLKICSFKDYGS